MPVRLPFRYLKPVFFGGLFDDPLLYVKIRPSGRGLLFDAGKMQHVAKRVLKSLDVVFVSHAHMDHFMGLAALTRSMHVSSRQLRLYGPPGILDRLYHLLAAFDWNLAEDWWGSWLAHAVGERAMKVCHFDGRTGFAAGPVESRMHDDGWIYRNTYLRVRALILDHKIPVLGFCLEERPGFGVDLEEIRRLGLSPGAWIDTLRLLVREGRLDQPVELPAVAATLGPAPTAGRLYRAIGVPGRPASLVYLTDFGMTEANFERLCQLPVRPTLLVCECAFLREEKEQARRSMHLCTEDLNLLLDRLRPDFVLPMHLSKAFLGRSAELYAELEPPSGTQVLRLPDYCSPRPLLADDVQWRCSRTGGGEERTWDC
ncbi:ribonuclease Z [Geothermobacter ehrlichii]|uniref:Ribonuclease Z n=1 Tax=Geothermobacter ehrlichii TaxID=213224 RepID=A0A5D3WLL5_9BACT|nr:MBL fold metallo-hydrolase [Geothermobacter ehrlichii]TYO99327.1 ribonuclease Z [Geothermobacter ehrlichii]